MRSKAATYRIRVRPVERLAVADVEPDPPPRRTRLSKAERILAAEGRAQPPAKPMLPAREEPVQAHERA
jgi:hypothetical protein